MKKIITLLLFLLVAVISSACNFKKSNWQDLTSEISFDSLSLKTSKDGAKTAWFRTFISDEYEINNKQVSYEEVKVQTYCNKKTLDIIQVKSYDGDGKLLKDEISDGRVTADYTAYADGRVYFEAMCGKADESEIKNDSEEKIEGENINKTTLKTMTISDFLYDKDSKHWEKLYLDKDGNVSYKGKVILKDDKTPLNDDSAFHDEELEILFIAKGIKPKKDCDPTDRVNNGSIGCYIANPEEE